MKCSFAEESAPCSSPREKLLQRSPADGGSKRFGVVSSPVPAPPSNFVSLAAVSGGRDGGAGSGRTTLDASGCEQAHVSETLSMTSPRQRLGPASGSVKVRWLGSTEPSCLLGARAPVRCSRLDITTMHDSVSTLYLYCRSRSEVSTIKNHLL